MKATPLTLFPIAACLIFVATVGCGKKPDVESVTEKASPQPEDVADSPPVAGDENAMPTDSVDAEERRLPMPGEETPEDPEEQWGGDFDLPEKQARKAFLPPPGATALSADGHIWADVKRKRVYADGYVALKRGPLEMFACPVGTKEHESIVAVLPRSQEVHAGLLAVGASPGTPVRLRPEFLPPTGQVIRVWVCWYDSEGAFQTRDAREWIQDLETQEAMDAEWVFAGSSFWQDPDDKREYYLADSGDMICVSNFSSAMLDVSISSSAEGDLLRFVPFEDRIPDRTTPVRLVLAPVPNPTDEPAASDESNQPEPPDMRDVPRAEPDKSEGNGT